MGFDDRTDGGTRPTRPDDPVILARDQFVAELRAGRSPRMEDYLDGLAPAIRPSLLRELIIAERDWKRANGLAVDPASYLSRFPAEGKLIDDLLGEGEPTETVSQRERGETEACLLFGLLALANGLITPEALTWAFEAWAGGPTRSLGEVLVERGLLDESDASMIAVFASKHLEQHHGIAWESLIALGKAVRFRLDPGEVADSELRVILNGFVDRPAEPGRPDGAPGFGPRYEILKEHKKGGLGVISLAHDREIHREVVVKEIRADCADNPDYRERFLREAEVTGRLEHPGIVPVYGMGYHDDGRPYYIMRFIRGETLKAAIHRLHKVGDAEIEGEATGERLDLHALVGRFVDACHAIAYAHHRKILHRDIKPINIMLGPFGETLVVDWGLAKSFDGARSGVYPVHVEEGTLRPESGSGMTPTRYGSEMGTIGYMSPEQAAGRLTELGPPSDIYSLGVTLHYLATGHAPFEGAGKEEFLRRVRHGHFPRPSKVNPAVPPPLEAICLKCMKLRPIDRYQTVTELIDDLERWMAGNPVLAYPEPPIDRLARWARKHKTPLAGAAVLLVCTTIGLAFFAERKREENRVVKTERDEANRQRAEADKERAASESSRKFALGLLKSTLKKVAGADLAFLARSEGFRARMADELVESYRKLSADDPDDRQVRFDLAQACQLAANIGRSMGKIGRPGDLYAWSIRLLESLDGWNPPGEDTKLELATLHNDAGEYFGLLGKPKEAEAEHLEGLKTLRQPVSPARPAATQQRAEARLQLDLSGALIDLGRLEPAKDATRLATDRLASLTGGPAAERTDRLLLVLAAINRGTILRVGGRFDEAKAELAEAAGQARQLVAAVSDPDTRFVLAAVRNEQGLLLLDTHPDGPWDATLKAFEEALIYLLPLYNDMPGLIEVQRSIATTLNGRGRCLLGSRKLKEAREDFTAARELMEQLNKQIPENFHHLGHLGWAFANLGRVSRAEGKTEAVDLLLKAIEYHSAALKLNADSPGDEKHRDEARRELIKLTEGAAVPPPRP